MIHFKLLKSLPVQLILCVVFASFVGSFLNTKTTQFFFTLSCLLKDYLMFLLPAIIMSYIASAILGLKQQAPFLLLGILLLICLSNFLSIQASYYVSVLTLPFVIDPRPIHLTQAVDIITPLFDFPFPDLISPKTAMIIGIVYGLSFSFSTAQQPKKLAFKVKDSVSALLQKTFIPLLPIYVFGFVLKMNSEGTLKILFENCGQVIALMVTFIIGYILMMYAIACRFNLRKMVQALENMMPAFLTGFTTMSSTATMPITLSGTEKNLESNKPFAHLIIPTTVNIHMLADSLGIPLLALAVLQLSGSPLPDAETYLLFTGYCCLAKFSSAGIPGGSVFVVLPLLQAYLGLTPEMAGLVTTLYILQDSIFTSLNVLANGAFALLSHQILGMVQLVKPATTLASSPQATD